MQNYVVQPQPIQVPNYSGVNIQIFNPTVGAPGCGAPVYNVNSPNYQSNPNNHYPAGYYINQWGSPQQPPSASGLCFSRQRRSQRNNKKRKTKNCSAD